MKINGAKIKEARLAAGMTQASLAMTIGTRERNIIRWENDQHEPRAEFLAAVAKATGKTVEFFVGAPEVDASTAPFRDAA